MRVTNEGDRVAYIPGDGVTHALEPGDSVDLRFGVADYAVRNIKGVRFAEEFEGQVKGVSEAGVEAAVEPIAEHVSEDPTDTRYAVVGDAPGSTTVEVIPGSPADHVEVVPTGDETEAEPTGDAPSTRRKGARNA